MVRELQSARVATVEAEGGRVNKPIFMAHACERSIERVGVALSIFDLKQMSGKIQEGKAVRLNDRRNGAHQYVVTWKGHSFRVVYSPRTTQIITVLSPIGKKRTRNRQ